MSTPTDSVAPQHLSTFDNPALTARKSELRLSARLRRDALSPCDHGERLARHLLDWFGASRLPNCVGGYWPIGSEIDIRPALSQLSAGGARLALPRTGDKGSVLRFHAWNRGDPLLAGRFGTMEPDGLEVTPDLLLVPMLAFDRSGHRLGYGGGYYDRTLAARPGVMAVGCAYAAQELDAVPVGTHDISLTLIATENGVIRTQG